MDEKLVNEAIAGSREAFCRLYGEYKDRLYRYALYRLGDPHDAEDAVSECVLAAWKGIRNLRSGKAFGSWIFSILSACCAARIKSSIREREKLQSITQSKAAGSEADSGGPPSLSVELSEALLLLKEDERDIVLLSVIGDLNSSEISSLTGIPAGTVRSRLSRSLAKMREFLTQGETK